MDDIKLKSLELAVQCKTEGEYIEVTIARAKAFEAFLKGQPNA
jgi:hypothetical protein